MKKLILLIFLTITSIGFAQNDYYLAETYYREGAYEKATQVFKKLYAKSPFNTSYLSRLISCYQETEKFNEVEKILKSKLKKNSYLGFLYVYLGYNYQRQKLNELANKNYNLALKSIDKHPSYTGIIGRIFKDYSLLDNAILAYEKGMLKNENINYSFQIAQIYGEKGNLKKMFEFYINLVDKNKDYLSLIQRYTSSYITEDSENEANILFIKTFLRKAASKP
jgi:tetratricopeptide (TPR) repeat protein